MHLKSLVLIIAVLVNMATTLPDPNDLQNPQENQVNHSESQDKHGHQSDGHGRHEHHSEVENLQPQSRPIPTKQDSGAHHHVHSTSSSGVPHQTQFSQFFPPQQFGQSQPAQQFGQSQPAQQFGQSQPAQQFGRFPQGQLPFGYQQPSPQLLNCQCYPASQPLSPLHSNFQQHQLFNAFPTGFQQPSFQQPSFQQPSFQQPSYQQPSQQINAFPNGFQQQQSSSKDARPHCHITCHEH